MRIVHHPEWVSRETDYDKGNDSPLSIYATRLNWRVVHYPEWISREYRLTLRVLVLTTEQLKRRPTSTTADQPNRWEVRYKIVLQKRVDRVRETPRPNMSNTHNHAPHTVYKGDRTESAQWRGKKEPTRPLHVNTIVREHHCQRTPCINRGELHGSSQVHGQADLGVDIDGGLSQSPPPSLLGILQGEQEL